MRLNLDARSQAILRRLPAVNVYSAAELGLLGLLAVQCARLTWVMATPVAPLGEWRPAAPSVPASPGDVLGQFDPFFRISGTQGPRAVTSLAVKLFGIRIDEAMGRGSAILAGPDGVQKSVSVGEEIAPGVTLRAVAFDHVTVARGGGEGEDLYLDQSTGLDRAATVGDEAAASAPGEVSMGITATQFQTDIGFIPRLDGGKISGLAVRSQGSGAAFRAAGLREGDIVTSLGGRPVTGQGDLQRVTRDYPNGGNVPLVVERGGQTLPLSVRIAPAGARL